MQRDKTLLALGGLSALGVLLLLVFGLRAFDRLEDRLDARSVAMEDRFDRLVQEDLPDAARQGARQALAEEALPAIRQATEPLAARLDALSRRVDDLTTQVSQTRTALAARDTFLALLTDLRGNQQAIRERLTAVDEALAELRGHQDTLRQDLALDLRGQLEEALNANEQRLRNLLSTRGGPMVEVPAGAFVMGVDKGKKRHESPAHEVFTSRYLIDQYEVSNAQYARFVQGADHRSPDCTSQSRPWTEWDGALSPRGYDESPAVCVSWSDARAFCEWAGKRLPTEAEWEKAARGTDGRLYPWGDELTPEQKAMFAKKPKDAKKNDRKPFPPVGSYATDTSPYGVQDLSGSVLEWVWDYYGEDYYAHSPSIDPKGPTKAKDLHLFQSNKPYVLRGGWWSHKDTDLRIVRRQPMGEHNRLNYVGFRCAATL